jgi:cytochrome c553
MPSPETLFRKAGRAVASIALFVALTPVQAQQQPSAERLAVCMACHGPQGNSRIAANPSLAGQPRIFLENQMVLIREGLRDIPQMKGLLDEVKDPDIGALAAYFSAQAPVRVATTVDSATFQRGQAISERMRCGTCHLPDYAGRQQIPRLAGQQEAFLVYSMKQFRDHAGPGRDTIMSASLLGLKDNELADLAHFLSNFR